MTGVIKRESHTFNSMAAFVNHYLTSGDYILSSALAKLVTPVRASQPGRHTSPCR